MECLIGVCFKDFVLVAADTNAFHSVVVMKNDVDKMYKLSDHLVMLVCGEPGDTIQFAEFIAKNIQLYKMRNGYELSPASAANYTRQNMAEYLRSRTPYSVNLLMAGFDKNNGAELYYIDYLATMAKVPYTAHGYGGYFVLSVLDKYYRPDMSVEEATELMKACLKEIHTRFVIGLPKFKISYIDKDGVHDLQETEVRAL